MFGISVVMNTEKDARARQINDYAGINGVECLDMGSRMAKTAVSGKYAGPSIADVEAQISAWYTLDDGVSRTLIDSKGVPWNNVLIGVFSPKGRMKTGPGYAIQEYEGTLIHLTID